MQINNKFTDMNKTIETSPAFQHAIVPYGGSENRRRNLVLPKRYRGGGAKVASEPMQCPSFINGGYDSLRQVPMFYPIERTSTVVSSRDPSLIASRILACLQRLSITAQCNASESEVRVLL